MTNADVALCTYNDSKTLARVIESVIHQENLGKLYIVDDFSNDDTVGILKKYEVNPQIVIIRNQRNIGLAASLNIIISASQQKYLARIDADDEMLPGRLAVQLDFLQKNQEFVVVGSNAEIIKLRAKTLTNVPIGPARVSHKLDRHNCILHPTVMMNREVINTIGGYDTSFKRCQDYALWLRLLTLGYQVTNIDNVTTKIWVRDKRSVQSIFQECMALIRIGLKYGNLFIVFSSINSIIYHFRSRMG